MYAAVNSVDIFMSEDYGKTWVATGAPWNIYWSGVISFNRTAGKTHYFYVILMKTS
jgi:hypothetical protein